ncbi:cobalamin B12-binding domain-containing protein [Methanobacterium alkalithermotolerans]|uniref:Cobalamin B12-binding domain-containing protein n=1 Tax=Methanobacterium alkalithermotolerans TaxID=2731220 RepID=A0A8T8K2U9_9EURY|nr:cobalamin-dependent protein [Methanobacterium alkalithermotolerans]QUH22292.1 cobalamin B12-binding domain-containing protein [Methanobacterium alkalithermotolerans]RJS49622.1 MAG: hypothetical protein CIT03_02175 [Methanobacterium sp.]
MVLSEFEKESGELSEIAQNYLDALLNLDRYKASKIIHSSLDEGVPIKDIYIKVFESSQHEVGRLWQKNIINVAQEHYCSASTQQIMSELYPVIFKSPKKGYKLLATCVAGEMHEIGLRMVADIFELEGWDSYYLGANTPLDSILDTISTLEPDVVAISASIHFNIPAVKELVDKINSLPLRSRLKIMVGGRPFSISPELWKKVGADATASNALEAIKVASELIS